MAGRASIVGAAETNVGKVRDHNEDAHFIDPDLGIFVVCDGMGGHAAGEVASSLAVKVIRERWAAETTQQIADRWLAKGTPEAHKQLIQTVQQGVIAAHDAIVAEATADRGKSGMGTTLVGAIVVGGDIVFAHCGDSRAYLVRDGIAMQLTEDHTLLARLLAAGIDVDVEGDGARFKSMLTNALGIGHECKVATFVIPVADGDRFLLCSDGITEYVKEAEIGEVLSKMPSPARAAQKLVDMALERGGGDNATALVVRVLEAGETSRPSELLRKENDAIFSCPLWAKVSPQQRLRALRIALPRDHVAGAKLPVLSLGDRVAWILVEGEVEQDGVVRGPGSLVYPEALLADRPVPDKDGLAVARGEVRALALRADDFREICDDDAELAEVLLEALAAELATRRPARRTGRVVVQGDADAHSTTDPGLVARADTQPADLPPRVTDPSVAVAVAVAAPAKPAAVEQPAAVDKPPTADAKPPAAVIPPRPRSGTNPGTAAPQPRAPSPDRPSAPRLARSSTPPSGLIVPATERASADAAFDRALSDITIDSGWDGAAAAPAPALPVAEPPTADDGEPGPVIEVEANEPPERPRPIARPPARPIDQSEPEISIEALVEMEADEPASDEHAAPKVAEVVEETSSQTLTVTADEPSGPEIMVTRPGRPITANDTSEVSGTIEPQPGPPKRAKRQTDAPD